MQLNLEHVATGCWGCEKLKMQLGTIIEEKSMRGRPTQTPLIQDLFEVQMRILRKCFGEQPPQSSLCH